MKPSKEVIEAINEIHTTNDKVEKLIHKKNRHSIYHMCIRHGFGIHFPFDNKCPSCDNETYLYISADDILSLLQQQREEILDKVEAKFVDSSWIIGECELWEVFTKSKWNKFKKSL